jgi:hypothetical protein
MKNLFSVVAGLRNISADIAISDIEIHHNSFYQTKGRYVDK